MSAKDCADRVDAIIAMGNGDPEARHSEEDMLMRDVFQSIISDGSNARELAWEVIRLFADDDVIRWWA